MNKQITETQRKNISVRRSYPRIGDKFIGLTFFILLFSFSSFAQNGKDEKKAVFEKPAPVAASPLDIAKTALLVHGGEKLKKIKSLVMKGSVDLSFNGQGIAGAFSTAFSGDKYFFEINNPLQPLKQVYDGQQTYSSIPGFSLPPVTSLGFPLLPRIGDTGYVITALGDGKKKKKGFRVTTPEGFYTDFFINEKTGLVRSYESSYEVSGRVITTSVEIDEYETVDGIVVPKKYSQRFDLGQLTAYASFKTKTILVNSAIEAEAFSIPK